MEIRIPHGQHVLLTCWPAKRRGVNPRRARTSWELELLDDVRTRTQRAL